MNVSGTITLLIFV